ncbi:MAG: hypothetical protein ACYCZY_11680, partial [Lacisediminihabitans sp.]
RYVNLSQIPESIRSLYYTLQELLSTPEGTLKLLLIGLVFVLNFALLIYALYAQSRPKLRARISTAEVFIVVFVGVSAVSLLAGQVATGSITNRYLLPLFIFPLLTCVVLGVYILRRLLLGVELAALRRNLARFAIGIAGAASSVVIAVGLLNVAPVSAALRGEGYTFAECLDNFLGSSHLNGVGSFWTARPLQLYGKQSGQVLQVNPDLTIFKWMINLASYNQAEFSYVIYDTSGILTRDGIREKLGDPRDIVVCDDYEIYDYRGTPGEQILTQTIRESRLEALKDY